ncbi:hypothetical protein IFM89_018860 [Coptis chinensis]|uniref:Uncharacterized protein n=1 Tax=Coptis chinensis TaxID=261450 RepID=A0A835HRV3_9MAGN|nr:hypothetical protein IFM89_018860 [Coptis chinensis]
MRISMHTLQLLIQLSALGANIAEKYARMIYCELLLYEYEDIKQRAGTKWMVHGDKGLASRLPTNNAFNPVAYGPNRKWTPPSSSTRMLQR